MPRTPVRSELEGMLREASLRVTRPRLAVLAAVHHHQHADTDSIINAVRADVGDVSHQAVYDVLRALTVAGLLRRIQPMGSVARYEARVGDNHHHAVCRSCGAIFDVDCVNGASPCLSADFSDRSASGGPVPGDPASGGHGFEIDEAEVIFWGICSDCSSARSSST